MPDVCLFPDPVSPDLALLLASPAPPCRPAGSPGRHLLTVGNLDMALFAAGYTAGEDAALDGTGELPGGAARRPRWWRIGWVVGNLCTRRRMSAWSVGAWCRTMLGLPAGVNPWLRDTPSGLAFEEGWGVGLVRGGRR